MDGGVTGQGKDSFAHGSHMDPRVEAAARALYAHDGAVVAWGELDADDRDWYVEGVRAALAAADAVDPAREVHPSGLRYVVKSDRYREALERIAEGESEHEWFFREDLRDVAREALGGGR